jgi:hypothetical protein
VTTIRGADVDIELFYSGAWHDLTCDTTSASWTWGAPEALGPLTECEGGTLRVSLYDPGRDFDPDNPSSPLLSVLKVGLGFRVMVDAAPAWTGVLQTWGWDHDSKIADLNGTDPIGMLSMRSVPKGSEIYPGELTSAQQAGIILDLVEWPSAKRYFPSGTTGVMRGNDWIEGSAFDILGRMRFAELGRLYPMRDGKIGWHARVGPTPPASSATINCTGIGLTDMWKVMGLGRVRNHVVVGESGAVYGPVLPPDEYRSVNTTASFLGLIQPSAPAPSTDDLWAQTVLDALEHPPVLTMLDTMLPIGAQVKQLVCAEFGARWTVKVTGQPDVVVQLFGMTVDVEPGSIEVTAVTEDIVVSPPSVLHATASVGSGHLLSFNQVNYTNARNGSNITVATSALTQFYVGQYFGTGPEWGIHEGFVAFDTSSIPAGATIVSATFGAQITADWPGAAGGNTFTDFDIQLRSGSSWLPTLAAADWIVGAGSTTLRAVCNTNRGGAAHGGFFEWTDAGSGLAGAVVKGGTTQLYVVSSRTVSGTAPSSTSTFEDVWLDFPRLRVDYR